MTRSLRNHTKLLAVLMTVLVAGAVASFASLARAHPAAHQLSIADASAAEGDGGGTANGAMTISITPAPAVGETVSVDWSTSGLGATAVSSPDATVEYPEDYAASSGQVTFVQGETSQPIAIPIGRDAVGEGNETFKVNIFSASSTCNTTCAALGGSSTALADSQGVYTITEDDVPSLAINDITRAENADAPAGTTAFTFVVTRTGPSASVVSASYATENGSAVAPGDYTAESGTVTFPASLNATDTQNIVIDVVDDSLNEGQEAFRVNLTTPVNATISDAQGVAVITDNDPVPNPTASVSNATVAEGGALSFNVTLSQAPGLGDSATVNYATSNGTASAPGDYTAASGVLIFGQGESTQPVTVTTIDDSIDETDETLTLTLTKPAACCTGYDYDIGDGTGEGTITDNDATLGTLAINNVTVTEGDSGTTAAVFTVTKSNTEQAVTVNYATANNTAVAPGDYGATSGTLSFTAAQTTRTITVNVNGDSTLELEESFFVNLTSPTNATISDGQGVGTITDDDAPLPPGTGNANAHDFNGDGFADAAFGVPGESIGSAIKAGAVNVIYGTDEGLSASSPQDQQWFLDAAGVEASSLSNDRFGSALTYGNFNGDDFDDLAIGIPGKADGAGAVTVLYGSLDGLTADDDQIWSQAAVGVEEDSEDNDGFGSAVAAGDFDSDGFDDLGIGVPGETVGTPAGGAVNVLYGSAEGLTADGDQVWSQESTGIAGNAEAGDRFGAAVAAGDINGDGNDDLAVGARGEDAGSAVDAGVAHVIYGSAAGLDGADSQLWDQDASGVTDSAESGDTLGSALAIGDIDGDTFGDLALGVPREDVGSKSDAGAVNVLYGTEGGLASAGNQLWSQDTSGIGGAAEANDLFGASLRTGDFDGDANADLAVGTPGEALGTKTKSGLVHVILGTDSGLNASGNQAWTQDSAGIAGSAERGDVFGTSVSTGDFDGDGSDDLVIGVPGEDLTGAKTDVGAANVIYSGTNGLSATGDQQWHQDTSGVAGGAEKSDAFGSAVS